MRSHRTFTQKVGAGFAVTALLTAMIGIVGVVALRQTASAMDRVARVDAQQLVDVQRLRVAVERKVVGARTYLLTGSPHYLDQMRDSRTDFTALSSTLKN